MDQKINHTIDIETFVRLKYQLPVDCHDWLRLNDSYPEEVRNSMVSRWNKDVDYYRRTLSNQEQWNMYFGWLFEELCKYELEQQ